MEPSRLSSSPHGLERSLAAHMLLPAELAMLCLACFVKPTNRMDEPVWCHIPGTPALRQLEQEDHEFKASCVTLSDP